MVKRKIKLQLSPPEWQAMVQILKAIEKKASRNTITEITVMECIINLYWRMVPHCNTLRPKNNLSLSLPEAWAIAYTEYEYGIKIGKYEATIFFGILNEIDRQAINMQGTLTLGMRD